MTKSTQNEAVDFLRNICVVPQSVVSSVDQNTVLVDPAGLPFIQGDVAIDMAGGASGAIYETIGIHGFPAEVMKSITAHTDAAWWQYENKASPSSPYVVIHVAGPDFRRNKRTAQYRLKKLTFAYYNVLLCMVQIMEVDKKRRKLRLLPISSGVFAGAIRATTMIRHTWRALYAAWNKLTISEKNTMRTASVRMCSFDAQVCKLHTQAKNKLCKNLKKSSVRPRKYSRKVKRVSPVQEGVGGSASLRRSRTSSSLSSSFGVERI